MVGSPHLINKGSGTLTREHMRSIPLLHDSYGHWQKHFGTQDQLHGSTFNQISLAIDAALAGQGLAIVSRAFVQDDLSAGRLIDAGPAGGAADRNYYLVRKKSQRPRPVLDAVWSWCLETFQEH